MARKGQDKKGNKKQHVLCVIKGFREDFLVIKDGDGKWQGRNLAVWAKRGKWYFNIQLLGKGENQNISWDQGARHGDLIYLEQDLNGTDGDALEDPKVVPIEWIFMREFMKSSHFSINALLKSQF